MKLLLNRLMAVPALCASALLLSACKLPLDQQVSIEKLPGLWRSDGYHLLLEVTDSQVLTYELSQSHCLLVDEQGIDDFVEATPYVLTNHAKVRFATDPDLNPLDIQSYYYDKVHEYPLACANGVTAATDDAVVNFQAFWDVFNEQYAFFELRDVDWQDVYNEYYTQVEQLRDAGEEGLFDLIEEILPLFNDGHVFAFDEVNDRAATSEGDLLPVRRLIEEFLQRNPLDVLEQDYMNDPDGFDDFNDYIESRFEVFSEAVLEEHKAIITSYMDAPLRKAANDKVSWGIMQNGRIGYLSVSEMADYVAAEEASVDDEIDALETALNSAIDDLKDTDAVIVDVRLNGGGADIASLTIASRFYDKRRLAFSKRPRKGEGLGPVSDIYLEPSIESTYQKPVYLLTSAFTGSAAEIFTLSMKRLPHVMHIGESTNGILSDVLEFELPNGWFVGLSNEIYQSAAGEIYEAEGIPVDYEALLYDLSYRENQLDSAIEAVFENAH